LLVEIRIARELTCTDETCTLISPTHTARETQKYILRNMAGGMLGGKCRRKLPRIETNILLIPANFGILGRE
jgi:hypothetical protein